MADHTLDLEDSGTSDLTMAIIKARDLGDTTWIMTSDGLSHAAIVPADVARAARLVRTAAPVIVMITKTVAPAIMTMLAELERLANPKITITGEGEDGH